MRALRQSRQQAIKLYTLLLSIFLIFGFTAVPEGGESGARATDASLLRGGVIMAGSKMHRAYAVLQYLSAVFALDNNEELTPGLKNMITYLAVKVFQVSENAPDNGAGDEFLRCGLKLKMSEIARACNLSRRTIINYLQKAERLNILQIVGYRQRGCLNTYVLNPIESWAIQPNNQLQSPLKQLAVYEINNPIVNGEDI